MMEAEKQSIVDEQPKSLDAKGRCCGRKPLLYKRPTPSLFCTRCDRAYSVDKGEQIANWAYAYHDGKMIWRSSRAQAPETARRLATPAPQAENERLRNGLLDALESARHAWIAAASASVESDRAHEARNDAFDAWKRALDAARAALSLPSRLDD